MTRLNDENKLMKTTMEEQEIKIKELEEMISNLKSRVTKLDIEKLELISKISKMYYSKYLHISVFCIVFLSLSKDKTVSYCKSFW